MEPSEFLQYTITHYNANNRSHGIANSVNSCTYCPSSPNSKGCAIGQHLSTETQIFFDNQKKPIKILAKEYGELLPLWMQKMSISFLQDIQSLHDRKECWDENGITNAGWNRVAVIKDTYKQYKINITIPHT